MIDWGDILETEDHKAAIEKLYENTTLELLSEHLGVSLNALRDKMMKEDIPFKPRYCERKIGKSRLDSLPQDVFGKTPTKVIAKLFDMHVSAVYKYMRRRGIKGPNEIRAGQVNQVEEAELRSEDSVGESNVEVQPSDGKDNVLDNSKSGVAG